MTFASKLKRDCATAISKGDAPGPGQYYTQNAQKVHFLHKGTILPIQLR